MNADKQATLPPIYIVTGGTGASAEQVVNTVLAQYQDADVPIEVFAHIREVNEIEEIIKQTLEQNGTIVHTLVDSTLREYMINLAQERNVVTIDLMGPLMDRLSAQLGVYPLGRPGLYRHLHRSYFERIAAIEYTLAHDDGRNRQDWSEAEIVLIGVSRSGKTPLSVYLSVLGWKVANMPIVPQIPIPPELYELPRKRVIGLLIDLERLLVIRHQRSQLMGMSTKTDYTHPGVVDEELRLAKQAYSRGRFHTIDVTHQPIEATAEAVIKYIARST